MLSALFNQFPSEYYIHYLGTSHLEQSSFLFFVRQFCIYHRRGTRQGRWSSVKLLGVSQKILDINDIISGELYEKISKGIHRTKLY